jgi:hypothetical protein
MYESRQGGPPKEPEKIRRMEVYWTAVTYRTVAVYFGLVLLIVLAVLYVLHPDWYSGVTDRLSRTLGATPAGTLAPAQNQARFVNLDGTVQVKRVNSVNWVSADYHTMLDKGDEIHAGADGAARITFVDGTTYTVKSDTFVTVEENATDNDRSTSVAVHISSGAVDLATGTWDSPRSKAEVSFANARASLQENSRAAVQSDPGKDQNQITVSAGAAQMQVDGQQIEINKYERVSFANNGPATKTTVLAPPELTEPVNLEPLIVPDPKHALVHFAWAAVPQAVSYDLRISSNTMFTQVAKEQTVAGLSVDVTGLEPGDYFWSVTATDAQKRESAPSEPFKFTLVTQGKGEDMLLSVDSTELHGNVVELIGRADPGAALLVNGESVADIQPDGKFRYFTQPLSRGSHEIVVVGQNRRGGSNVKHVTIVIP